MNAVLCAVYLPNLESVFVVEDIFSAILKYECQAQVFIGIQFNSVPQTEDWLTSNSHGLRVIHRRVPEHCTVNSDASSFVTALCIYSESNMDFDLVYFVHTKGVTSGRHDLRNQLLDDLFTESKNHIGGVVGSYAKYLTITSVHNDIEKMACMRKFNPHLTTLILEYYYLFTFFTIQNKLLRNFLKDCDPSFFHTNVTDYSDRWMMERDFAHIVDMQGCIPSYSEFHGNYSTGYVIPEFEQYQEKLWKWENEKHTNYHS